MYRIVLECDLTAGLVAKVVMAARSAGVEPDKQRSKEKDNKRIMQFDFGSVRKAEIIQIHRAINQIDGVHSAKVYQPKTQPSASASDAIEDIVESLDTEFPEIGKSVAKLRSSIEDPEEAISFVFGLGQQLAKLRFEQKKLQEVEQNPSVEKVIAQMVMPELEQMGDVSYVTEGYETGIMINKSVFTTGDNSKSNFMGTFGSLESQAHKCDFLRGYIQGLINVVLDYDDDQVVINETRCRNEGHPYCLFEYEV